MMHKHKNQVVKAVANSQPQPQVGSRAEAGTTARARISPINATAKKLNKPTRSADRWTKPPGSLDSVNARRLFASDNAFGIPMLADNGIESGSDLVPVRLVPFRTRLYSQGHGQQGEGNQAQAHMTGVHLFVEDYRAEAVWTRPVKSLGAVKGFGTVLSPDFSLYRDWPPAIQIWNTYRSRWVAAWWQSHGLRVVPSVAWAGPSSYSFCFLGIPQGQVVAVSIIGLGRDPQAWRLFSQGFEAMLERLAPRMVLCHGGALPPECQRLAEQSGCELKEYEPLWTGQGQSRRANFYPLPLERSESLGPEPELEPEPQESQDGG